MTNRSRIHMVRIRVSEFHPYGKGYGCHPKVQDSGFFVLFLPRFVMNHAAHELKSI